MNKIIDNLFIGRIKETRVGYSFAMPEVILAFIILVSITSFDALSLYQSVRLTVWVYRFQLLWFGPGVTISLYTHYAATQGPNSGQLQEYHILEIL